MGFYPNSPFFSMIQQRTYTFIEEFLKWNFEGLPPTMSDMIYGSPSFAMHLSKNLGRMRVENTVSLVLFEDPFFEIYREAVDDFLIGNRPRILDVPTHFVVTLQDDDRQVHYDSRGDLIENERRIKLILDMEEINPARLVHRDKVQRALYGTMLNNVRTVMDRMERMYIAYVQARGRQGYWKDFKPYHEILAPSGDNKPKVPKMRTPKRKLRL